MDLMQASDLGIRLAVMMALCTYGGYRLDQWRDSQPLFLPLGAGLGLGGGMWTAIRSVDRLTGRSDAGTGGRGDDDGPA